MVKKKNDSDNLQIKKNLFVDENDKTLKDILCELSKGQDILKDSNFRNNIKQKISEIYTSDFRHLYSEIFLTLSTLDRDSPAALDILGQNLKIIYAEYCETAGNHEDNIVKSVKKLYDHVTLDISRKIIKKLKKLLNVFIYAWQ